MPLTIKFLKNPFNISCSIFCLLFLKFTFFFKQTKIELQNLKIDFHFLSENEDILVCCSIVPKVTANHSNLPFPLPTFIIFIFFATFCITLY